jgi:hypothetical protein
MKSIKISEEIFNDLKERFPDTSINQSIRNLLEDSQISNKLQTIEELLKKGLTNKNPPQTIRKIEIPISPETPKSEDYKPSIPYEQKGLIPDELEPFMIEDARKLQFTKKENFQVAYDNLKTAYEEQGFGKFIPIVVNKALEAKKRYLEESK